MRSDKIAPLALMLLLFGLLALGCNDRPEQDSMRDSTNWEQITQDVREPAGGSSGAGSADWGEDWSGRADAGLAPESSSPFEWTILLKTFPGEGRHNDAARMIESAAMIDGRLAGARVHTTDKGAMVVYGRYQGVDDPDARSDLESIKAITDINGRPILRGAMLTRLRTGPARRQFGANELMGVRLRLPPEQRSIEPLYTLQVGVWSDFDSGELSWDQVRASAEKQVRAIRARGHDAFYHHDPDKRVSSVTVGLFDHTALDVQSGLELDPVLQQLRIEFPAHLVNGLPIEEFNVRKVPSAGTHTQTPRLVLIPLL